MNERQIVSARTKQGMILRSLLLSCALFFLVSCLYIPQLLAEDRITTPVFQTWTIDDGLPSGNIAAMARGPDNHIWLGTREGLVRFNGSDFMVLRHDPKAPSSLLPTNSIQFLYTDKSGRLWVSLEEWGLLNLNSRLEVEHRFTTTTTKSIPGNDIWAITEACDGSLWLGFYGDGLARLWPDTGQLRIYPPSKNIPGSLNAETVISLLVDSECQLWVGTWGGGLLRLRTDTDHFELISGPWDEATSDASITALMQDNNGRIWAGTRESLFFLDPGTEKFQFKELETNENRRLLVTAIHQDVSESIWVTSRLGIFQLSAEGVVENRFLPVAGLYGGLPTDFFWTMTEDHEGGVWFGSLGQGVVRLGPGWKNFQRLQRKPSNSTSSNSDNIISTYWDQQTQHLWAGTMDDGLSYINPDNLETIVYNQHSDQPESLMRERTRVVFRDQSGRLWLGHSQGLSEMISPGHFKHWFTDPKWLAALGESYVSDIHEGENGTLWLSLYGGGAIHFDPSAGLLQTYNMDQDEGEQLTSESVSSIEITADGVIWLGGDNGLQAISATGRVLHVIDDYGDQIRDMTIAPDGTLWVASVTSVSQYQLDIPKPKRLRQYSTVDGLPPTSATGVRVVNDEVWVTTRGGLVRIRPEENTLRVFSRVDGLPSIEFEDRTMTVRDNKQIYAGTSMGVFTFEPAMLLDEPHIIDARVFAIRTIDQTFPRDEFGTDIIRVAHDAAVVTFEFGALTFSGVDQLRYRYRLLGHDPSWVIASNISERSYSRLAPGSYVFEIQSSVQAGKWPDTFDRTILIVNHPPWRSWQAYLLYLLFALGIIVVAWYRWQMELKRRSALALAKQREQSAETQRQLTRFLTESLDLQEIMTRFATALKQQLNVSGLLLQFRGDDLPEKAFVTGNCSAIEGIDWIKRMEEQGLYTVDWSGMKLELGQNTHVYITPLVSGDELLGVAIINGGKEQPFTPTIQALIRLDTKVAASAIQNARLYLRVQQLAQDADLASTAKSDFLATMSHEIRTPLNGVLGMSDLLSTTELNPQQRSLVDSLRHSGENLLRVLNEVLDLSKVEAGAINLVQVQLNLNTLLEQVMTLFVGVAAQRQIELVSLLGPEVPVMVIGDPAKLEQVLCNLLSNAIKFTESGYVVFGVNMEPGTKRIKFFVRDTGIGISAPQQETIFDAFTQVDQTANRKYGGTGLGLTISQRMVQAMGGSIILDSNLGEGSCFHFSLPLVAVSEGAQDWLSTSLLLRRNLVKLDLPKPLLESVESYLKRWSIPIYTDVDGEDLLAEVDTMIIDVEKGFENCAQVAARAEQLSAQYPGAEFIFLIPFSADLKLCLGIPHAYTCQRPVTSEVLATVLMEINLGKMSK